MKTIYLKDIISDTYTNASGYQLLLHLQPLFADNVPFIFSFKDSPPPSTSFLNSSFGELIDLYGLDKFKSLVKFHDLSPTLVVYLKNYFSTFSGT
jgi:hypothetical protein